MKQKKTYYVTKKMLKKLNACGIRDTFGRAFGERARVEINAKNLRRWEEVCHYYGPSWLLYRLAERAQDAGLYTLESELYEAADKVWFAYDSARFVRCANELNRGIALYHEEVANAKASAA